DTSKPGFKEMLVERDVKGHSKALVTAIRKGGRVLTCQITSATFQDDEGSMKSITTIEDISPALALQASIDSKKEKVVACDIAKAQVKSDVRLAENNKWIQCIAKTSYDVMWDWDVATGEIYVGDSIEELFGYKVTNNNVRFSDFGNCLVASEKKAVHEKLFKALSSKKKSWKDTYKFKCFDGSVAATTSRASIVRDEEGKAIRLIGATHDLSRQCDLEGRLKNEVDKRSQLLSEYQENFKLVFNSSSDVLYDVNISSGEVLLSNAYEQIFGYQLVNNMLTVKEWFSHIHLGDKEALLSDYAEMIVSQKTEWSYSFRFVRQDASVANVLTRCIVLRDDAGKAIRRIGYMQDTSQQHILEESLELEIASKEGQIQTAAERAKEAERMLLGEELHDNVNQLLCASKLYLEMAKGGGDNLALFLRRSSEYTELAMEEIRKLTKGLTTATAPDFNLQASIQKAAVDIMGANTIKISTFLQSFREEAVQGKMKLYIFRIVQEQLNNIIKHAGASDVIIELLQNHQFITLTVSDNGLGFDTKKGNKGIGVKNIRRRAAQFKGTVDFLSSPGKGCVLSVAFPIGSAALKGGERTPAVNDKAELVDKIKSVIIEEVFHYDFQLKTKFSAHLAKKLRYSYTYMSNVFSQVTGTSIEQFIIARKIDRVKDLISGGETTLTKIALALNYSSVAHLSAQFKKVTGFTPSSFKQVKSK
ncbi:MAG TPA: PAS domain-containing protein, partial [Flavisolibacter sp.]|nr:PAS domain-containing protein [Flavisolibacter sp.]